MYITGQKIGPYRLSKSYLLTSSGQGYYIPAVVENMALFNNFRCGILS